MHLMETLEGRRMLSWAAAPFAPRDVEETIYVDQLGNASISGKRIDKPGDFDGYQIYFDDPGYLSFEVHGNVRTQIAFYNGPGRATQTAVADRRGNASISNVWLAPEKRMLYIGVQATNRRAMGTYDLIVHGVKHNVIRTINPAREPHYYYAKTDITDSEDADFFSFKTDFRGSWSVWVVPDKNLDVTIHVFDEAGRALGGSYTKPINHGGVGKYETWTGRKLKGDTTYYVRIDGNEKSTGRYQIFVRPTPAK